MRRRSFVAGAVVVSATALVLITATLTYDTWAYRDGGARSFWRHGEGTKYFYSRDKRFSFLPGPDSYEVSLDEATFERYVEEYCCFPIASGTSGYLRTVYMRTSSVTP